MLENSSQSPLSVFSIDPEDLRSIEFFFFESVVHTKNFFCEGMLLCFSHRGHSLDESLILKTLDIQRAVYVQAFSRTSRTVFESKI